MATIYTQDDLKGRMKSPGWALVTGKDQTVSGTLENMLKIKHGDRASGLIQEIATAIELDLIQVETLWRYLGLPD